MTTAQMSPCPFCGSDPGYLTIEMRQGGYVVVCRGCSTEGPWADGNRDARSLRRLAVRRWNQRITQADGGAR